MRVRLRTAGWLAVAVLAAGCAHTKCGADGNMERTSGAAAPQGATSAAAREKPAAEVLSTWIIPIYGTVVDGAGKPVESVLVSFPPGYGRTKESAADGAFGIDFELSWAPPDADPVSYVCARRPAENLCALVPVVGPTRTVRVQLAPGAVLTGRVLDQEGRPIEGARVAIRLYNPEATDPGGFRVPGPPWWQAGFGADATYTDAEGRWEMRALPPGCRYALRVSAKGHDVAACEAFAGLEPGNTAEVESIVLQPAP